MSVSDSLTINTTTAKHCDDVLLVWYEKDNLPRLLRQYLEQGECRLLFCMNDLTLTEALTATTIADTKILVVLPAESAHELLPILNSNDRVVGIDIWGIKYNEISNYQPLLEANPKLLGIYPGLEIFPVVFEQIGKISSKIYVNNLFDKDSESIVDLSRNYDWFKRRRVSRDWSQQRDPGLHNSDAFIHFCRSIFALNPTQLDTIDEFQRSYRSEDVINWYSKDCFLYKVINRIFRSFTVISTVQIKYIDDLCQNLQLLWQEQRRQHLMSSVMILRFYRGLCVPQNEIDRLKASEGHYVAFSGFLSTTKSYTIARIFARNVLCEIEVDPHLDNLIFADISEYSQFDEQEVLFSLYSTFFLSSVLYDDEIGLWKIKLIGASENELIEDQLKYHSFTYHGQQQEFIGDEWFELKQYSKSISYYEKALLLIADENKKADIFWKLAETHLANKEFAHALSNSQKALDIEMTAHPPSPYIILEFLLVIAVSHACLENYDFSIEYHMKYLTLADSFDTDTKYAYSFDKDDIFTPALSHLSEILTNGKYNNDTLAKIHLNIAILCDRAKGDKKCSCRHFNMVKRLCTANSMTLRCSIWYHAFLQSDNERETSAIRVYRQLLKLLNLNHIQTAMIIHYAIARCNVKVGKHNRALHNLNRALTIEEKYFANNELSAKILYIIGMIHYNTDKFDLALEFLKRSLIKHDNLERTSPTNYDDNIRMAIITENIAECYRRQNDSENCLVFTKISLEKYLIAKPEDIEKHADINLQLGTIYLALGEINLCFEHLGKAASIREGSSYGDARIAKFYSNLSELYQSFQRTDLAIDALMKSLVFFKKCASSSLSVDWEVFNIEQRLAAIYSEKFDFPSAMTHSLQALHILQEKMPTRKEDMADLYNNIGWFYYLMGDLDNALLSCQTSLELSQECLESSNANPMSPKLSYVLNSLGFIYLKTGDDEKAFDFCQKSFQTLEHERETEQYMKSFADNYELLADINIKHGRQTLSFNYYLKALDLYRQVYYPERDHPDIQRVLNSLSNIDEIEF